MFTTHFKMARLPFQERLPVESILCDERLSEGLARLRYLAEAGSIGLVSGPTGVGKSSLLRLFVRSLSLNLYQPIYLSLTHVGASGLLRLLVTALGEVPRRGKERLFLQIVDRLARADRTTLLLIDEAHLLPSEALTDLRLLVSAGLDEAPRLKLLLSGQDLLGQELKRASHADLTTRISVRYHIPPLTREQSSSYIDSQLKHAGASERIFDPEAKSLIHDYSSGIPRQINSCATACLLNAASKSVQKVTEALVNDTMADLRLP
ncbi:MAG: AAA family ATPase [Planctomycetes bacterium]|nr:AAA family ATPase [Planctomycetota bacterium]